MAGKWGQGRIEVAAHREEIEARLSEGWTVRQLYLKLRDEGNLTISLSTFSARVTHIADDLSPLRRSYDAPEPKHAPFTLSPCRASTAAQASLSPREDSRSDTAIPRFNWNPHEKPIDFSEG
ncbi:MAG: hypothetical protein AB7E55_25050 [Pigmentiphaga sp.]